MKAHEAVIITLLLGIAYVAGYADGSNNAECTERWRHQVTPADTLTTIRGGCALPGETT